MRPRVAALAGWTYGRSGRLGSLWLEFCFVDETVVSPALPRRRLPRLRLPRLPRLPFLSVAPADPLAAPLIATYRRPSMGRVTLGVWLTLLATACVVYGWLFASNAPHLMVLFVIPQALLLMLLIWALPEGEYAPLRTMEGFYWFFFIALVLWPNYLAIALPGLPWVTLVRIADGPLVAALLLATSVSKSFRAQIATCLKDSPFIWKSLVFYLAVVTFTLPMSGGAIGISINKYIVLMTNQVAIFFLSVYLFLKPRRLEIWMYMLLAMTVIICLLGLWEARIGQIPWAGHIPSFLQVEDDTVTRILAGSSRSYVDIHRVQVNATTPLTLAEYLGLSAPFVLHLALGRYPPWLRVAAAVSVVLIVRVILLSQSRLGMVAILVAAALYLLVRALVQWREVRGSIFGPAIVLGYPGIFIAMVASTLLVGALRRKVWGDGSQDASNAGRKAEWVLGLSKFAHNPIGHGYGTAGGVLGFMNQATGVQTIDSYWLNLLLDTGIVGFVAYMALFLGTAWQGAKAVVRSPLEREQRLLIPLSVTLVAFIVVKGVLSQDNNHPMAFMMLGAIVALIHRSRVQERQSAAAV
jgi:hypothetical protein